MTHIKLFFVICFLLLFSTSIVEAQSQTEYFKAKSYLLQKREVYFTFNINSKTELNTLTQIISIDNVKGMQVFAYANTTEFEAFRQLGYDYTVLPHPGDVTEGIVMHSADKGIWQFDTYPTYTNYESMMTTFAANYPSLCKIIQIGTTPGGRKLLVAKISDNVNQSEAEPQFLYSSSMHGDELTGYILMLRLINHLLTNYGTNSEVADLVNNMEIYINPLANPDGTYAGGNNSVTGATRENGAGIDINRNFPGPTSLHPDGNVYQPENIAMMAFIDTMNIVLSANFHGGAEVMNYPFDTYTSAQKTHADDAWFQYLSREFADTVHTHNASLMTDLNNGVTNGGDWYVITGGRQDYMCWFQHGREITIELSGTKLPASSQLIPFWNYYYRSLINYMKQCKYGLRGSVTDACTGTPLVAKIFVNTHDRDSSTIYSNSRFGDYYRPINAGSYTVTYSANGYISQTLSFTIANKDTIIRNIQLAPVTPVADFVADATTTCSGTINFTCLTSGTSSWNWDFGDGTSSIEQNPMHNYTQNGTFTVSLTAGNCVGTNQIIKTDYIVTNISSLPVVSDTGRCGAGSVNLTASGSGSMYWYGAATGGNILAIGNLFATPSLSQTTTFYVENTSTQPAQHVGKPDSIGLGNYFNTTTVGSLIFNCSATFTLMSVKIYAGTAGNKTIQLLDNAGTILQSATINVPRYESRVTLNFIIHPGTGYRLALATSNANLFRSGTTSSPNLPYPYTIANVVSITGNSNGSLKYYNYFYDWEVQETGCSSARLPVVATISPAPIGGISTAIDTSICSGNNTIITVSGNSGTTIQWQQSSNGITSWTDAIGVGTTSSSFTTPALTNTIYFRAKISENGCTDVFSTTRKITVNSIPQILITPGDISCYGISDGTASASATSGLPPYSYNWSNGNSGSSVYLLHQGTFTVTVTDSALCSSFSSFVINEPIAISANMSSINATCGNANGSASVVATGGTGTLTYLWSNSETNNTIQNLQAGTYLVTIRDANNCSTSAEATVGNDAPFNANVSVTDALCNSDQTGIAYANVSGGTAPYYYHWSTGGLTETETGLGAGTIYVTITDSNNCSIIQSATINQPNVINATISTTDASCNLANGSVNITATGGTGMLTYSWSNGATDQLLQNLDAGQYAVTVTDNNNCTYVSNAIVNDIPTVIGNIIVQNVGCYNGANGNASADANLGTPPYTYHWSTGGTNASITGLSQGVVSITIIDANNCSIDITDTIYQPMPIQININTTPETNAGNSDGSASATVTGGTPPYNYSWSNSTHGSSISGMPGGSYSLAIMDTHGCFATTPVVIDVLNSVRDFSEENTFNIFPNPAKDKIQVLTNNNIISLEIRSITGQYLLTLQPNKSSLLIDISSLSQGIYYIKAISKEGKILTRKFLIIK